MDTYKSKQIVLIISVIIMTFLVGYIVFASTWVEPTASPPADNISAPINTGINRQQKTGALNIGPNSIGISIGYISAQKYCDNDETSVPLCDYYIDLANTGGISANFAGSVIIDAAQSFYVPLAVRSNDNNEIATLLTLTHNNAGGVGSTGFGTGISFRGETKTSGEEKEMAKIGSVWKNADAPPWRSSELVFSTNYNDVLTERLRIEGYGALMYSPISSVPTKQLGKGIMYFSGTKFRCSENGADFADCIGGGGGGLWTDQGTYIYPNNYTDLVITDSGDVGIGTTSPNAALQINGAISRQGTNLYGLAATVATHVNLGVDSTTGLSGSEMSYATVGGGDNNTASGAYTTVGGGRNNTASASGTGYTTIGGGYGNTASSPSSTIGGGYGNRTLYTLATEWYSTIGGGTLNTASEYSATIGGGYNNAASGTYSTIGGGSFNAASGTYSTIGGGGHNTASGFFSTVPGGYYNTAGGTNSVAMGQYMNLSGDRSFVFGYSAASFPIPTSDVFLIDPSNYGINVGIGMTTPGTYKLNVNGTVATGDLTVGVGGAGKINVGTIDPIFDIDGKKYATYMADFAGGTRVETSGTIQLTTDNLQPKTVIDFDGLEKGSDLWLFWQTSNKNINDVALLLTPGFEGKVWYEKNGNKIIIYGDRAGEVSYRLSAPRVDHQKWGNLTEDQNLTGIKISDY